jgi:hypothetical protein
MQLEGKPSKNNSKIKTGVLILLLNHKRTVAGDKQLKKTRTQCSWKENQFKKPL